MDPVPVPQDITTQVSDDAALLPKEAASVAAVAHEVQPAPTPSASELGKLAQSAGDNPLLALGLAAIAVLGGGSAWKLWTKRSEQSHELAMKRLELDAATINGTAQPPPCQTKQAETDAKIAAIEARLGKVEKASLAVPDGFDADELTGRLGKVEAAVRRMGVKAPAPKGGSK
jgi:hypothetical protein